MASLLSWKNWIFFQAFHRWKKILASWDNIIVILCYGMREPKFPNWRRILISNQRLAIKDSKLEALWYRLTRKPRSQNFLLNFEIWRQRQNIYDYLIPVLWQQQDCAHCCRIKEEFICTQKAASRIYPHSGASNLLSNFHEVPVTFDFFKKNINLWFKYPLIYHISGWKFNVLIQRDGIRNILRTAFLLSIMSSWTCLEARCWQQELIFYSKECI